MSLAFLPACVGELPEADGAAVYTAEGPRGPEQACAWFGDRRDEILYFGQSAFWSTYRASGGNPSSDLERAGPALIGRFDLAAERLLAPLDVAWPEDRSGVWDVLAHPNGRVYFTTYFASAGWVDPASGAVERFENVGNGLNELALGADGRILASRYGLSGQDPEGGGDPERGGAVAVLDPNGNLLSEFFLKPPSGFAVAPKTVAWDRVRRQIWVTTDLLPVSTDPPRDVRHDTYVLDDRGFELRRIEHPEIQFVAFAADGTGYLAEVSERELWLRILPPSEPDSHAGGLRLPLDSDFAADLDFVQDIQFSSEGDAVVSRWSGWVHLVGSDGEVRSLRLPTFEPDGLYYTAALRDDRVCATLCRDVSVVCRAVTPYP
ncbi:MAG: hypothetical protein JRG83_20580 [Deltaproteobacteria bacterium]|nr:hypothetical protein [Deltaproteobacteria bacterium]